MKQFPSLRRLIDVVDQLVDERVGIVRLVTEIRGESGSPDFFHVAARACDTQAFISQTNFGNTGGASADRGLAVAKAIGEAVERYCGAFYEVEELPLTSFAQAPFRCVNPQDFALYSQGQYDTPGFPFVPFEDNTPVRWTPALDPLTNETWYVPAAMVYIPYLYYVGTGEAPIVQPISTGIACHCSPAEAAITAICEVIERDAFTLTWQAQMSLPHVLVETLSDANYDLVQRFERTGNAITLLDLTLDSRVPTTMAILTNKHPNASRLVVAASADLDPENAVRKCLEELEHTRQYSQQIKSNLPPLPEDPLHENVIDQVTHLQYWCSSERAQHADFFFRSNKRRCFDELENLSLGNPERNLRTLLERIRATGHRALLVDVTTSDVRSLGLSVIRAVIPGFHPLFMGYGVRALGGNRLWEVPQQIGQPGITRERGDNPQPHPYP